MLFSDLGHLPLAPPLATSSEQGEEEEEGGGDRIDEIERVTESSNLN